MDIETARTAVMVVGTVIGAWIAARVGKGGSRENQLIARYEVRQKDLEGRVDSQQNRLDSQQTQMDKLATLVARLTHRDLLWDYHATRVEGQVTQLGGEPYPRPEGLHPLESEE